MSGYTDGLYDKNINYDRDLMDARKKQREYNTNEAIQNLEKINTNLNNNCYLCRSLWKKSYFDHFFFLYIYMMFEP